MKIKMLRSYRGWASDEQFIPDGEIIDHPKEYAEYLVGREWAVEVKEEEEQDLEDLGYRELQALCKENGLNARGSTEELIERLENEI